MADKDLKDLFRKKTNEELLKIVTTERDTFQRQAIKDAESILLERGVDYKAPEEQVTEEKSDVKQSRPVGPFIVGILFVALAFIDLPADMDQGAAWTVTVTLNIFMRVIVVSWAFSLAEQFNLNKTLWVILGILFGGWALLAVNFVVWVNTAETHDEEKNNESNLFLEDKPLESCPACNCKLTPQVITCPDCGLNLQPV